MTDLVVVTNEQFVLADVPILSTVEVLDEATVTVTETVSSVIDVLTESTVIYDNGDGLVLATVETIEIISEGVQGPAGVSTGLEEEVPYSERIDIVTDTLIYKGQAVPGTVDATAGWRIKRLTIGTDGDVTTEWADGDASFNNTWTGRASSTYS